jgi:hypothetical protein
MPLARSREPVLFRLGLHCARHNFHNLFVIFFFQFDGLCFFSSEAPPGWLAIRREGFSAHQPNLVEIWNCTGLIFCTLPETGSTPHLTV